jgi:hypothetical protein
VGARVKKEKGHPEGYPANGTGEPVPYGRPGFFLTVPSTAPTGVAVCRQ